MELDAFNDNNREKWNTLELYYNPCGPLQAACGLKAYNVNITDEDQWKGILNRLSRKYQATNQEHVEYCYMDLVDIYDVKNDTHRVIQRDTVFDQDYKKFYVVGTRTTTVPTYRFPNVNTLDGKVKKDIMSFRHSHLIHIHMEEAKWDNDDKTYRTISIVCQKKDNTDTHVLESELEGIINLLC